MNSESKSSSLCWAIGELTKQKEELSSKFSIAQKREDTNSLIDEVNAQKVALEKRISSLEDGLKASSSLVDQPLGLLEEELNKVDDKLQIAQNRLNTLEQEEYLEELGRKLNGDFVNKDTDTENNLEIPSSHIEFPTILEEEVSPGSIEKSDDSKSSMQISQSPTPVLMKSPTNRIETEVVVEEGASRVPTSEIVSDESKFEQCSPVITKSLEECANALGMEPEYLLDKGMQAVLRMISRNGNKVSFPLEVEQVEKT